MVTFYLHDSAPQASAAVRCLGNVMPHLKGRRGAAGGRQGSAGARGEDTVVLVPVGTRVWVAADELRAEPGPARGVSVDSPAPWGAEASAAGEAAEEEDEDAEDDDEDDSGYDSDDEGDDFEDDDDLREEPLVPPRGAAAARKSGLALLADLSAEGATVVAAAGGRGGRGNSQLDLDKPGSWRDRAEPGEPGQERRLLLELCSVADVGLVGPPNVGKSSLLVRDARAPFLLSTAALCGCFGRASQAEMMTFSCLDSSSQPFFFVEGVSSHRRPDPITIY